MKYFDLHSDTANRLYLENLQFDSEKLYVNSRFSELFEKWYQCFAVFIDDKNAEPFCFYESVLKDYKSKIKNNADCSFYPILTVENGKVIEDDINRLSKLKEDGVFSVSLTWNGENKIAGGAKTDVGLKPFGVDVIKEMNNLKIAVDLSHLNSKSFYGAIEYAEFPIATHICFNEINNHKRNIDLEKLKLISQKNGIVGICLYPEFLGVGDIFENFYRNIALCLENGFEDNIAIGSDFDGCKNTISVKDIPKIYDFLLKKGLPQVITDKIFFENAFKYAESFDKL